MHAIAISVITVDANAKTCLDIVNEVWRFFEYPQDRLWCRARKHASNIDHLYISILDKLRFVNHAVRSFFPYLFLSSYFIDDIFDVDDRPYAVPIGLYLYSSFYGKLYSSEPQTIDVLNRYYKLQMEYQLLEKNSVERNKYKSLVGEHAENYYVKQVILLFPLEFVLNELKQDAFYCFKYYYNSILLADDLIDYHDDKANNINTPITCELQTVDEKTTIQKYYNLFTQNCEETYKYASKLDIINDIEDRLNYLNKKIINHNCTPL